MGRRARFRLTVASWLAVARFWGLVLSLLLASVSAVESVQAQQADSKPAEEPAVYELHTRLGVGWIPVVGDNGRLPTARDGFGGFVALFFQLPWQLSTGLGGDLERYRFDSTNAGEGSRGPPAHTDETLDHVRALALVQYDVLPDTIVNPFVFATAGYVWTQASLVSSRCSPKQVSGMVFGAGAGVELHVFEAIHVGVEYRFVSKVDSGKSCLAAFIPDEPLGAPYDFFPMRIALTLGVRDLYF